MTRFLNLDSRYQINSFGEGKTSWTVFNWLLFLMCSCENCTINPNCHLILIPNINSTGLSPPTNLKRRKPKYSATTKEINTTWQKAKFIQRLWASHFQLKNKENGPRKGWDWQRGRESDSRSQLRGDKSFWTLSWNSFSFETEATLHFDLTNEWADPAASGRSAKLWCWCLVASLNSKMMKLSTDNVGRMI